MQLQPICVMKKSDVDIIEKDMLSHQTKGHVKKAEETS